MYIVSNDLIMTGWDWDTRFWILGRNVFFCLIISYTVSEPSWFFARVYWTHNHSNLHVILMVFRCISVHCSVHWLYILLQRSLKLRPSQIDNNCSWKRFWNQQRWIFLNLWECASSGTPSTIEVLKMRGINN